MAKDRLQEAEISMAEIKKDISFIKDSLNENRQQHAEIMNKLDNFIESSPDKFASKKEFENTEDRVKVLEKDNLNYKLWVAGVGGGAAVLLFVLQIVGKHFGWL